MIGALETIILLCNFHENSVCAGSMPLVYVLLNTEPSQMENVLKAIKEINGVEEAYMVY